MAIAPNLAHIERRGAYLRTMVVHACWRWKRNDRREAAWATPAERAANVPVETADALALRAGLAELPQKQRTAVVLRFFADLTFEDISAAMDCPTQTAASHVRRGIERLRNTWRAEQWIKISQNKISRT